MEDYRGIYIPDHFRGEIISAIPQNALKDKDVFRMEYISGITNPHLPRHRMLIEATRAAYALHTANLHIIEMSYFWAAYIHDADGAAFKSFRMISENISDITTCWKNNIRDYYYPQYEEEKKRSYSQKELEIMGFGPKGKKQSSEEQTK